MRKVAVIVNPNAGNKKLINSIEKIEEMLLSQFEEVAIHETKKEGDGAKLVEQMAGDVDLLIGAGGDGTIYELVNALAPLERRPVFAIIPGGTCNDFSRTLGINQHPVKAVEQILEQNTQKVDIGRSDNRYFMNFWGIGLVSKVSDNIDSGTKQLLGRISYYIGAGQTVLEEEPFHLKIESETNSYEGDAVMLLIGNGSFLGGIQSFFPYSSVQDGDLDVLIIKQTSIAHLWTWLQTRLQNEAPTEENDDLVYFRAKELKVEASPNQVIDTDGEKLSDTPATVTILPNHLEVIVGDFPLQ
ncbi:diacylglycerol kinase family lipid kinase [Sutcliffiella horikoshii]|uniref:diacylglycerol/lipid kinase family protein n=1 Tax=Sutcliffiella horikoshii TaxID=79883 RepID=UPI00203CB8B9|nr:diacylglycerol kinase family protein [Sutcliffiella horikoshii]MCM3619405.1 diacylglycerol kinase family lipid kinase [Sutcliffiella horikoshii]